VLGELLCLFIHTALFFAVKRVMFKVDVSIHHGLNFSAFLLLYCSLRAAAKPAGSSQGLAL